MGRQDQTWIGLIRAIGGATHARMSMTQLREACERRGLEDVRTVLATGNVIFRSALPETGIQAQLDAIIAAHGLTNEVFLRRPEQLTSARQANPFSDFAADRPDWLLVLFMDSAPTVDGLPEGYDGPERMRVIGREAFIAYPQGIGRSRLTGTRLERHLGRPGTARNWNTIARILTACGA